ncbi:MAG: Hsp20 family protein [Anaerolineales bacterium]|nr:Hsp20 family protein [Anaerolineales bacterium]
MALDQRPHRVAVQQTQEPVYVAGRPTGGVLANLYSTDSYAVLNVGLPRCLPEHIKVTLSPKAILVEAELHRAQATVEKERKYILAELPYGRIRRAFPLPEGDFEPHAVEAHFQNGLLTITIPTHDRDAYLHEKRGKKKLPEEV